MKKKFTKDFLVNTLGLPYTPNEEYVKVEDTDFKRFDEWTSQSTIIFTLLGPKETYKVSCNIGIDIDPWENEEEIVAVEVYPKEVKSIKWVEA